MQHCGAAYEYKIHLPGSHSFVGSNSSNTSGDLYTIDRRFNLSHFAQLRNKRMVDIGSSLIFIVLFPFSFFLPKKPGQFIANCFRVLSGKMTWIGYAQGVPVSYLPALKKGVIEPYNVLAGYIPSNEVKTQINIDYAEHYAPLNDVSFLLRNYKYLGGL